ncbi:MAG: hypothetical protein ED859_03130 [Desulfuromonadales bacterium]|nr:MAG: hypothetical protein ED859_03130 [Desulfuromonadales bacterium]
MEVFSRQREERYIDTLVEYIHTTFPEVAWEKSDEQIRGHVRVILDEAERFDLTTEYTIGRFLVYRLLIQEELYTGPDWKPILDILGNDYLHEDDKVEQIDTLLFGGPIRQEEMEYE